jgi:signal transduction histidine kinase
MTLPEISQLLQGRLRRPSFWGVFAFVYSLYALFIFAWPSPMVSRLLELFTAFLFYFAIIWLAPLPWEWSGRSDQHPGAWRAGAQAFLFSEGFVTALVLMENAVLRLAGENPQPLPVYMLHLCFYGPAIFLVGNLVAQRERSERDRRAMSAQVSEAQGRQLQGQLHPHVLFNALNALAELIQEDPEKAETNVRAMSSLLRRVLNASEASTFALGEERALVQDYLSMESMRLEKRLRVGWDWEPALDDLKTLPLLLQPLVENAVKHGIARSREGGKLVIHGRCETGVLVLEIRNTGRGLDDPPLEPPGFGIKNLRARLAMAYGDGAGLSLQTEGSWTVAEVRIQLDRLCAALRSDSDAVPNLAPAGSLAP